MPVINCKVKYGRIILAIIAGAFLILFLWMGRHPYPFLCLNIYHVEEGNRETHLHSMPVMWGDEVILRYIHSADGTPVEQYFLIGEDGALDLVEERYKWYGAGLEFGSDYTVTYADGWVRVSGYDRSFRELPIRVAATVPQELRVNEQAIFLSDLAPAAARLLVKVERRLWPCLHRQ